MEGKSKICPCLTYADAPVAIEWLGKAFSFKPRLIVPGEGDKIAHAQLTYENCMIMLSSSNNGELDKYMKSPGDLRGINTQSAYIVVNNIDEHYNQAKSAGAKMILDIKDQDYGGRGYTCQDPQGVIWNFGSYDPWG